MEIISSRQDVGIPGVYGLLLLDVVSRWGYSAETLFAPFHFSSEQLAHPDYRIPTPLANELIKHALKITGEQSLGYHLGTQMRISIHGFIGYAIMTASNISEALVLAARFIQLRMPFLQLYFSTFGDKATLQLQCDIQLEPLRTEIILALTIGIISMAKAITGINNLEGEIDFDFAKPEGFDRYLAKMPSHHSVLTSHTYFPALIKNFWVYKWLMLTQLPVKSQLTSVKLNFLLWVNADVWPCECVISSLIQNSTILV